MQYLRARYYDATTGRFVGLDPFRGQQNDPQSLHKYVYTKANPINGIDPTGWSDLTSLVASMSIGGGLAVGTYNAIESIVWGRPYQDDDFVSAFASGFVGGAIMGAGAGLLLGTLPLLPVLMATGGTSAVLGGLAWANGFATFMALGGYLTAEGIQDALDDGQPSKAVVRATMGIAGLTLFPMQLNASGVSGSIVTEAMNGRTSTSSIADFNLIDVLAYETYQRSSRTKTPACVSILWDRLRPFFAYTKKGSPEIPLHPVVESYTNLHPGPWKGGCAEPRAISVFLRYIEDTHGIKITTLEQAKQYTQGTQIQNRDLIVDGFPIKLPCKNGCDVMLNAFGIEFVNN